MRNTYVIPIALVTQIVLLADYIFIHLYKLAGGVDGFGG